MNERLFHIYTLTDPRDSKIRYVGCTIKPKKRLLQHMNILPESTNRKDLWLLELRQLALQPKMDIIFTTTDVNEAADGEIKYYDIYNNGELLCINPRKSRYQSRYNWTEQTNTSIEEQSETVDIGMKLLKMSVFNLNIIAELEDKPVDDMMDMIIDSYCKWYAKHLGKIEKARAKLNLKDFPLNLPASQEQREMFEKHRKLQLQNGG